MPNRSVYARDKTGRRMEWGVCLTGEVRASPANLVGFHPVSMGFSYIPTGLLFSMGPGFQDAFL